MFSGGHFFTNPNNLNNLDRQLPKEHLCQNILKFSQ